MKISQNDCWVPPMTSEEIKIKKLEAKLKDREDRLKAIRNSWDGNFEAEWHHALDNATNLKLKNWRDYE